MELNSGTERKLGHTVFETVASVRLNEPPGSIIDEPTRGRVDEESHTTRLENVEPHDSHGQELASRKGEGAILRVTPGDTLRHIGVSVDPTGIGVCVRPEETVIVGLGTHGDGIIAWRPIKVSFKHYHVVCSIR